MYKLLEDNVKTTKNFTAAPSSNEGILVGFLIYCMVRLPVTSAPGLAQGC